MVLLQKIKNSLCLERIIYILATLAILCLMPSSAHTQASNNPANPNKEAVNPNAPATSPTGRKPGPIRVTDVVEPDIPIKGTSDVNKEYVPISFVTQAVVLSLLAMAPFVIMLLTSFIKIVIVLSLLRNAIGSQQTPPNQIINGVAIILTLYVMFPTGLKMYDACEDLITNKKPAALVSDATAKFIYDVTNTAKEPLREFLLKHTERAHLQSFYQMTYRVLPEEYQSKIQPENFVIVIPSYVTSQLKHAFEISVMIFLPFFVVDLVTSNILLAMGMQMLSPMTISLPLKLLLLVMVDGWTLIIQGLVLSYYE